MKFIEKLSKRGSSVSLVKNKKTTWNLQKLFELSLLWVLAASILLFSLGASWTNIQNIDIGLVSKRSLDEYAFTFVISRMYEGLQALSPRNFFNISFFSYGFPYFFLQMCLTIPAQNLHDYGAMLIIERSFSLFWAVGTLILAAWWVRRRCGSWAPALLTVWLLIAMPGFVRMATTIHPDTMMNFFVVAGFIAAAELKLTRWREIAAIGILCGLGACAKIQVAVYVPFIAALVGLRLLLSPDFISGFSHRLLHALIAAGSVGLVAPLIYLILNPFLVHGEAFGAFVNDLNENIKSNATNHFTYALPNAGDKINLIDHSYIPIALIISATAVNFAIFFWRKRKIAVILPEFVILICSLVTGLYVFVVVQKLWESYYLTSFTLFAIAFAASIGRIEAERAPCRFVIIFSLALALGLIAARTPSAIASAVVDDGPSERLSAPVVALIADVQERVNIRQLLISPYTPLQFQKLGLRLTQIRFIARPLDERQMKAADAILLRKNDCYFDAALLANQTPQGSEVRAARTMIDLIRTGKDSEFALCAESDDVLIFCRRSAYLNANS